MIVTRCERITALVDVNTQYDIDPVYWKELIETEGMSEEEALDHALSNDEAPSVFYSTKIEETIEDHRSEVNVD